jgi:hypothetical protein
VSAPPLPPASGAPASRPAFAAADDVGAVVSADGLTVWVAALPGGPIHVLEGVAASIWTAATTGPAEDWPLRVATRWDQQPDAVAAQVDAFTADLLARGLLRPLT